MVSTEKVRADLLAMKDDKFAEFTRKLIQRPKKLSASAPRFFALMQKDCEQARSRPNF